MQDQSFLDISHFSCWVSLAPIILVSIPWRFSVPSFPGVPFLKWRRSLHWPPRLWIKISFLLLKLPWLTFCRCDGASRSPKGLFRGSSKAKRATVLSNSDKTEGSSSPASLKWLWANASASSILLFLINSIKWSCYKQKHCMKKYYNWIVTSSFLFFFRLV